MNRLLTNEDRENFKPLIAKMFEACPDMMARKIALANVQQAYIVDKVLATVEEGDKLLCAGSYEDTANEYLKTLGLSITEIDPLLNVDLHKFKLLAKDLYNIIFSTSVIEHVPDDEQFIADICSLLEPGGTAILTCDFKEGWKKGDPVHPLDCRFYTEYDLNVRLRAVLEMCDCRLVGEPMWKGRPDFFFDGFAYSFATLVFRKN